MADGTTENRSTAASWTFLSNYAYVLVCVARDPLIRLRDVAQLVGITERAAQRIVSELEAAGVLTRIKEGRRNRYLLHVDRPLRHPLEAHCSVGQLLAALLGKRLSSAMACQSGIRLWPSEEAGQNDRQRRVADGGGSIGIEKPPGQDALSHP